jgi:hypothetical protein
MVRREKVRSTTTAGEVLMTRAVARASFAVLLAASLASACASRSGAPGAIPDEGGVTQSDRSYIGDAELAASGETAYDIVQRLRPEYLRADPVVRGMATTRSTPALVEHGRQVGGVEDLRRMPASSLMRITYFSVESAKSHFGMQFTTAVLEIAYRPR